MENTFIKIEIEANTGEYIRDYIKRVHLRLNKYKNATCTISFNGVVLDVSSGMTENDILNKYELVKEEAYKKCAEDREYKKNKADRLERIEIQKTELDCLISEFENMDLNNVEKVVCWISKVQPYSDNSNLSFPKRKVLVALADAGYKANEYCGDYFNAEDKTIFARYVIGQAISTLQVVSIHQVVRQFADNWIEKFNVNLN